MAFVISSPCIGNKSGECVIACPADCIREGIDQYYIDPNTCTDCGACVTVCPVEAIYYLDDLPDNEKQYIEKNRAFFR